MRVLLIPCSIRPGALSPRVAGVLQDCLEAEGVAVNRFDLQVLPLHGTFAASLGIPPAVQALRDAVQNTDAICWVTPTYHNMVPAVALNALDLLDARVMTGKLNGVIGASNLTGDPGAVQIGNVVRFIGGRLPANDLYIASLNQVWPKDVTEPPGEIIEKVRAWTAAFLAQTRK